MRLRISIGALFAIASAALLWYCQSKPQPLPPPALRKLVESNTDSFAVGFFHQRHRVLIYEIKQGQIITPQDSQAVKVRIGSRPKSTAHDDFYVTFKDSLDATLERFAIRDPLVIRFETEDSAGYVQVRDGMFEVSLPEKFHAVATVTLEPNGLQPIVTDVRHILKDL